MVTKSAAISTATVSVCSHCPSPPESAVYTVRISHRKERYAHLVQYFGARGCATLVPSQYQQIQHPTTSRWCGLRFHGSQRCRGSIGHYHFSCASNPFGSFRLQTGISRGYWRLMEDLPAGFPVGLAPCEWVGIEALTHIGDQTARSRGYHHHNRGSTTQS